jgi:pyridoxamine 5'-phosphate oxidase family protein
MSGSHCAETAVAAVKEDSMAFTDEEIAYLRSRPVARLATLGDDGQPDVVPVAVEFDGTFLWVGGGPTVLQTRKFRNVASGNAKVALVADDLVSVDPFIARGIRVYGHAEQPFERIGLVGPGTYLRITPTVSWSWNLEGKPAGDTWYASRKAVHHPPPRSE